MSGDPESQSIIGQIILLVVLTLINAFFAAAEIAVVSLNKSRMDQKAEQGDKKAQRLVVLLKDTGNFLSTIQVGITLVNILSGASLADNLSAHLAPVFGDAAWAGQVSKILILALLTYISIVFGELYPKRIALNRTEQVAGAAVGPIQTIGFIMRPFVWLLSASTDLLAKLTPMKFDDDDNRMTRDEMRYMLENEGVLDSSELEMVQGVFSLDTKVAREVMVPRTDAFMINIHDSVQDNIDTVLSENYSRIPVYDDDRDKVIGVLHVKNLLKAARKIGFENVTIQSIIQEPLFVPETIFIDDLLYELKKTQNQMAILLDEYGGVVGIATLEDLLEEIVGEIDDESDEVSKLYAKIDDHTYLIQGKMLIEEFNEEFNTKLDMDDVDTMAGYLITALGMIPEENEKRSYDVDNLTLITEKTEGTRLLVLKVIFHEEPEEPEEPEEEHRLFHKDRSENDKNHDSSEEEK